MHPKSEIIAKAMTWDYDYIITQNFTFKDRILANYPSFLEETKMYSTNDKFTIYTKK